MGPVSINRTKQRRTVTVSADYTEKDLGEISRKIEEKVNNIVLPKGFTINMGGETQEQRESFQWLALIGAIIFVYMVMASQFESLRDPFVVLLTVPMALIGVVCMYILYEER